jgi:hypothetical protein
MFAANATSVRVMRSKLSAAARAAVVALLSAAFLAPVAPAGAHALGPLDEGHAGDSGALSYEADAIAPAAGHAHALQAAFARRRGIGSARAPRPQRLREARQHGALWAIATFASPAEAAVTERFVWHRATGWRDLGPTLAACPAVPPEVRSAWRLPSRCQTS